MHLERIASNTDILLNFAAAGLSLITHTVLCHECKGGRWQYLPCLGHDNTSHLPPSNSCSHEDTDRHQELRDTCVPLQMEACLVTTPSHESIVDFAFYKAGQIALLLKDKSRVSHGGSTNCRLVIFSLSDVPFMLLDRYSNGTNQLSQHVFEVSRVQHARCIPGRQAVVMRPVQSAL